MLAAWVLSSLLLCNDQKLTLHLVAKVYHPDAAAGRPDFSFFTLTHVYLKLDQKNQQAADQVGS